LIRKPLIALAAVVILTLSLAPAAGARTLSISKAKAAAQAFLDKDNKFYPYEPPKKVTGCNRVSARVVDCDYKAVSDKGTADCGSVRVRIRNHGPRRARVRFKNNEAMCAP
jgi:hypothetical protein